MGSNYTSEQAIRLPMPVSSTNKIANDDARENIIPP